MPSGALRRPASGWPVWQPRLAAAVAVVGGASAASIAADVVYGAAAAATYFVTLWQGSQSRLIPMKGNLMNQPFYLCFSLLWKPMVSGRAAAIHCPAALLWFSFPQDKPPDVLFPLQKKKKNYDVLEI